MVFKLGRALVDVPTPFALFTFPDLSNPGQFRFAAQPLRLQPALPHDGGREAIWTSSVPSPLPACARAATKSSTAP
jgi:hypothetical protein